MNKLLITLAVAAMAVGGLAVGVSAAGGRDAVSRPNPTVRQQRAGSTRSGSG